MTGMWEVGIGAMLTFSATWRVPATEEGTLTDPTEVTFLLEDPEGEVLDVVYPAMPIERDSAGTFHVDYVPLLPGRYYWRWQGTGAAHGSTEGSIRVLPSIFT